jgi:hypothetical protein
MGNKDNLIRAQQITIENQERRIKELESDLYKARLGGIGVTSGAQEIIDQADRDRAAWQAEEKDWQRRLDDLIKTVSQTFPVELLPPPRPAQSVDELLIPGEPFKILAVSEEQQRELARLGRPTYKLDGSKCWVGLSLVIRHDMTATTHCFKHIRVYPGGLEDVQKEIIPRLNALTARAPMREDFASAGLDISADVLDSGIVRISRLSLCVGRPSTGQFEMAAKSPRSI